MRTFGVLLGLALLSGVPLACGSRGTVVSQPCAQGATACGAACVDLQTDQGNCGACGSACSTGDTCSAGVCAAPPVTCMTGQVVCGAACVDPQTDPNHCGATADCAGANAGVACGAGKTCTAGACAGTCAPVALDLDTPLSPDAPPFASASGQQQPTGLWGSIKAPRPTNTSWENFVLGPGQNRVDFLPYQIKAVPEGLAVANSAPQSSPTVVVVPDNKQLVLSTYPSPFSGHVVEAYDQLSVTVRYDAPGGTMKLPLVYGSPYVTADYTGIAPFVLTGTYPLVSVNGATGGGSASGTRFELVLGDQSVWIVYASSAITFNWTPGGNGASGTLAASGAFTGTLRFANSPDSPSKAELDAHAAVIPRSGAVSIDTSCDAATVSFTYGTTGGSDLLMLAMPHQQKALVAPVSANASFATMSGALQGVVGSKWSLKVPMSTTTWTAPRAIDPAHVEAVRAALMSDASFTPDSAVAEHSYFGAKQFAKMARLSLIADELGETSIATALRAKLAPYVAGWLDGTNVNKLVYDTTWGGVVNTVALGDPSAQFGQGHYNDHHFHYGYFLYAAAVLAHSDPAFATTHRAGLLALVRDIANPSAKDPYFPQFRAFDFFRGHSWAAGLSEFADGQNQESTSEAVNAWYGMDLLGVAMGDARIRDLGRVMLSLEIASAQTYWQIPEASTIYAAPYKQNHGVGILFQTRAFFGTFFAAGPQFVYGIQMLPYTPITEELIAPAWVKDTWPQMQSAAASATAGWAGFLYMAHATIDPAAAWNEVSGLNGYDDGNSQTNALYWVATRP